VGVSEERLSFSIDCNVPNLTMSWRTWRISANEKFTIQQQSIVVGSGGNHILSQKMLE
jgi:hypothetical protein